MGTDFLGKDCLRFSILNTLRLKIKIWFPFNIIILVLFSGCNKYQDIIIQPPMSPWVIYGSLTDRDGNVYKTIPIGSQTWMVQNLKTTRYNDGTSIQHIVDGESWSNLSTPAYCWQEDESAYRVTYGLLYNWYAVSTGKLCPTGWHVSSEAEWNRLTDYLGGENVAGGKLKETGFRHWDSPNTGATNESYFRAFPGGNRISGSDDTYRNLRTIGYWWTTTAGEGLAASRLMFYDNNQVQKSICPKNWGLSVRCVSDY